MYPAILAKRQLVVPRTTRGQGGRDPGAGPMQQLPPKTIARLAQRTAPRSYQPSRATESTSRTRREWAMAFLRSQESFSSMRSLAHGWSAFDDGEFSLHAGIEMAFDRANDLIGACVRSGEGQSLVGSGFNLVFNVDKIGE